MIRLTSKIIPPVWVRTVNKKKKVIHPSILSSFKAFILDKTNLENKP